MNLKKICSKEPQILLSEENRFSALLTDLKDWICDSGVFAWQYLWRPGTSGTPFVCSPFVAKELLKYINSAPGQAPLSILEAGPGTGAMTKYLVQKLRPEDQLHLVEINEAFCEVLKKKYGHLPNIFIHNKPVQDWSPGAEKKFDVIISTVPLNSLPSGDTLRKIFDAYLRLIKPGGFLSSVEYVGTTLLCKICFFGEARKQFQQIVYLKKQFFGQHSFEQPIVLMNLPPARVTHCRIQ